LRKHLIKSIQYREEEALLKRESPKWTYIFIVICIVVFIIQQFTRSWIYFAFFPALALRAPWMFVTSIFLHADLTHLMLNMFVLFFFGLTLESMIGNKRFALLFLVSGIMGSVGYYFTAMDPMIPAIGASGAIYGILGTLTVLTPLRTVYLYGIMPIPLILVAVMWAFLDLSGLFVPTGIASGAHLAGMLVGVIYGFHLRWRIRRARRLYMMG
jgi:hypothetical protein